MKKIIILIVATVLCLSTLFAGCGGATGYKDGITSFEGNVSSNGGFAVVKGDYVYYINGVEVNTSDNTYGDVVTGALVRTKTSDLGKENAPAEMVIPALFVTGNYNAGFYIYGNDIYYASPRREKNKEGDVENTKLDFFKTSYDGKKSVNLATVADNTTNFRFIQVGETVYLVLETVNEDSEKVLKVINATDTKAEAYESEKIESVIFADDIANQGSSIYFTRVSHDEELEKDRSYNDIYQLVLGAEIKEELIRSGNGLYPNKEGETVENGTGIQGVKFALVKEISNAVIVKVTFVETDVATVTHYYALERINNGTSTAASVFAASSLYSYNVETNTATITYLDSTYGVIEYKYCEADKDTNAKNDYRTRLYYDADLVGYTVQFWSGEYLYATDASGFYHKVKFVGATEETEVEQITCIAASTSWYKPEIVGEYFLTVYTAEPYNSMVYATKNVGFEKNEDDEYPMIEEIQAESIEQQEANLKNFRLGILSEAMTEKIHTYYKNTFGEEDYKEYFGEESYNKYFGK